MYKYGSPRKRYRNPTSGFITVPIDIFSVHLNLRIRCTLEDNAEGSYRTSRAYKSNPLVSLTVSIDVDAVIVTHKHLDHYDDDAKELLPKSINITIKAAHISDVTPIS